MNPDVAQSVLPLTSGDLSLWTLFWNAHWIVKSVMVGLLICSVWVWAIVIDKTVLYARTRKAMDRFEQAFWSGQSLDELYRSLVRRTRSFHGGAVRGGDARMEAQLRGRRRKLASPACRCASTR